MSVFAAAAQTVESVLAPMLGKLNGGKSVTVQFVTRGSDASVKGSLTLCRERFKMQTPGVSTWYDGKTLWTYNDAAKETSVSEPMPDELMEINPFDILNNYQKRFVTKIARRTAASTAVEFVPKAKGSSVRQASLTIGKSTGMPQAMDITFANGSKLSVDVTSVTEGKTPAKSVFTYPSNQYPNVELIDLR